MDMEKSENIAQSENIEQSKAVIKQLDREYYLDKLARFRLLDDDFMTQVFQDNTPAVELLLNIVLGRDDISVTNFETQRVVSGRGYRSIRMDIHAVNGSGEEADIEIQRQDRGAGSRRARLHSAILDSSMLKAGQEFDEIADSYVIFITENDIYGAGEPIRSFTRRCDQKPEEQFGDGNHVIYVNGAYKNDDEPIGRLMHDFRCVSAVDMFYSELADKVRELKETKGGQDRMCKLMEDMRNEAAAEARLEQARETAFELNNMGLSIEKIAQAVKVTPEMVRRWLSGTPTVAR
ncbi:MAG: nuclease [Acetatifactor sp.]